MIVDTTVMEKAVAYPTDSRLFETGRQHLVALAGELNLPLRQNYNQTAPRVMRQTGRFAHARQYKRMRSSLKRQKTILGRVWRDLSRKVSGCDETTQLKAKPLMVLIHRLLTQKKTDKQKLYSLHAPEVECISKGKARHKYEFGVKVTVATTHKEGLVVGMRSLPGNPFDGHTLYEASEQVSK